MQHPSIKQCLVKTRCNRSESGVSELEIKAQRMHASGHNGTVSSPCSPSQHSQLASTTWDKLWPIALTVQHDVESVCAPVIAHLQPHLHRATAWTDERLGRLHPWQIAVLVIAGTWVALTLYRWIADIVADVRDVGRNSSNRHSAHALVPW